MLTTVVARRHVHWYFSIIPECSGSGTLPDPLPGPCHPHMRILHVTHELPPYETAGTAIYTLNIAKAQARDHEVFIFARLQDPDVAAYRTHSESRDNLTIRFMNLADISWSPFAASYTDDRAERVFREFLEEVKPDIVHFQHFLGFGHGVLRTVKELGIPTVFTLHDF